MPVYQWYAEVFEDEATDLHLLQTRRPFPKKIYQTCRGEKHHDEAPWLPFESKKDRLLLPSQLNLLLCPPTMETTVFSGWLYIYGIIWSVDVGRLVIRLAGDCPMIRCGLFNCLIVWLLAAACCFVGRQEDISSTRVWASVL